MIEQAARISPILRQAQAEGRDVTSAELAQLAAENDTARAALMQAIDRARSERSLT